MKKLKKNRKGITLIALVITIIVLLILAGVTIATLTGENGILVQAEKAKDETEMGKEKEILKLIQQNYKLDNNKKMEKESIESDLVSYCGENKTEVEEIIGNRFLIKFKESSNSYILDNDTISERINSAEIADVKINCINSNNEILKSDKTIAISGKVEVPQNIITNEGLEYITESSSIETTDNEINVKYLLVCNDDKTLVFTETNDGYMLGTKEGSSAQRKWNKTRIQKIRMRYKYT